MNYSIAWLFIVLLFSQFAYSSDSFVNFGVGVGPSASNSSTETRMLSLGQREFVWNEWYWENKGGFWVDNSGEPNRSSSLFGSSILGTEVNLDPIEFRGGAGLAFITNTDSYLGGVFPQFQEQVGVGVRDKFDNGLMLNYFHNVLCRYL
jgi:hypothetical protein